MAKRRNFTAEFKAELVIAVLTNVKSQAEVCREYQLKPQRFNRWKTQMLENAHLVFQNGEQQSAAAARISELEQVLGRKTLELEMAKKSPASGTHKRTETDGSESNEPRISSAATVSTAGIVSKHLLL